MTLVVAGRLHVDPLEREAYLAGCTEVVRQARATPGCCDFSLGADLLDPSRINVLEVWESQEDVDRFRGSGPSEGQQDVLREAHVEEHDVAATRRL